MESGSRKFAVWFISLMVLLAIYLFYSRLIRTPRIVIDTGTDFNETVAVGDINQSPDSPLGKIGDVGVGTVQKARYEHLNEDKQVDREFGFERLLHEAGDEWEIEKPFMNIFRPAFKCLLTADKGKVRVENIVGRPSPQDATLTGNVVIHILPENNSNIGESFIYLDDVTFLSEKSEFSTAGPVKFISQNANMLGQGLQLIYNDRANRLEFLRIANLDRLTLRVLSKPSSTSLRRKASGGDKSPDTGSQVTTESPQAATSPVSNTQASQQEKEQLYKCVLNRNVVIDAPEQLIFADKVSISNIASGEKPDRDKKVDTADTKVVDANVAKKNKPGEQGEPNRPSGQFADILVTCDGGILVTPMDSPKVSADLNMFEPDKAVGISEKGYKDFNDPNRITFVAQKIDYDILTGDTVAAGTSEIKFYVKEVFGPDANGPPVPVKITTYEKVEFSPSKNQVVFTGGCICKMLRNYSDVHQKYILSAPSLAVSLSGGKSNNQFFGFSSGLKHLSATGGNVKLAVVKTEGEKLLGGVELKCRRCDYDTGQQMFTAVGPPSVIKVDNSGISETQADTSRISLQRRCYAFVRDFETLEYNLKANQIVADANSQGILIDYLPIVQGQQGQQVAVTASHLEINLAETSGGKTELSALSVTGGVTYEDQDKQFVAARLLYNAGKSIITAYGDEFQPCLLNGALVDAIEYDLNNDRIRTSITGAGALQVGR